MDTMSNRNVREESNSHAQMSVLIEEYKERGSFIRLFFTLQFAAISACVSIFAAVLVIEQFRDTQLLRAVVLLITCHAFMRLSWALICGINRNEEYIQKVVEAGIASLHFYTDKNRMSKKTSVRRAAFFIYTALNATILVLMMSRDTLVDEAYGLWILIIPLFLSNLNLLRHLNFPDRGK